MSRPRAPGPRAQQRGDGVDRRQVLDVASRLLADEGPSALTMRRLASEVGASTMVLYSRFTGRDELMGQLLTEGFARFGDALGEVSHPDAFEQLRELGRAYRRFALENTSYFRLMWGPLACPPGHPPMPQGRRAYQALVLSVTRVLAALDRPAREAEPLALSVWSAVHGFVSLELSGALGPGAASSYELTLDFVIAALRR